MCSISRISPSWARTGCKKTLCLLHYPHKIKFIHSFILSLSVMFLHICRNCEAAVINCLIELIIFVCGIVVFMCVSSKASTGC